MKMTPEKRAKYNKNMQEARERWAEAKVHWRELKAELAQPPKLTPEQKAELEKNLAEMRQVCREAGDEIKKEWRTAPTSAKVTLIGVLALGLLILFSGDPEPTMSPECEALVTMSARIARELGDSPSEARKSAMRTCRYYGF